ncbi:MAG: ABC transporter ATP-binding protein [Fidelibacterota bacterium]
MIDSIEPPILKLDSLSVHFPIETGFLRRKKGMIRAVNGVSLDIWPGETLGLVGESGCGKSTLGRTVVKLQIPNRGDVFINGQNLGEKSRTAREVQLIFQDPFSSLNPRMTIGEAISEVLRQHRVVPVDQITQRLVTLMQMVELSPDQIDRYPHEFSGGQRQRIGIARALAVEPKLIICDEIVSALDVSVQAQILNLLMHLQQDKGFAYLFISHDLSVVRQIAHRIAVMYAGKIVEMGATEQVMSEPLHPYTQSIMASARGKVTTFGEVANPAKLPSGCYFHPRCPLAADTDGTLNNRCFITFPEFKEVEKGHLAACHILRA